MTNFKFVAVCQPVQIKIDDRGLSIRCELSDGISDDKVTEFLTMSKYFFFRKFEDMRAVIHLTGIVVVNGTECLIDEGVFISEVLAAAKFGEAVLTTVISQFDAEISKLSAARNKTVDKLHLARSIHDQAKSYE